MAPSRTWMVAAAAGLSIALGGCETFQNLRIGDGNSKPRVAQLVRLGDATLARGDAVSAIAFYNAAHAEDPSDELPLIQLGAALAQIGSYEESAGAYRAALQIDPDDAAALRGLGNAELSLGMPDDGLAHLQQALAVQDGPAIRNSIGVAFDMLGRYPEAQASYAAGIGLEPNNLTLANNLGLSLAISGNYADAIAMLRRVAADPAATARTWRLR